MKVNTIININDCSNKNQKKKPKQKKRNTFFYLVYLLILPLLSVSSPTRKQIQTKLSRMSATDGSTHHRLTEFIGRDSDIKTCPELSLATSYPCIKFIVDLFTIWLIVFIHFGNKFTFFVGKKFDCKWFLVNGITLTHSDIER